VVGVQRVGHVLGIRRLAPRRPLQRRHAPLGPPVRQRARPLVVKARLLVGAAGAGAAPAGPPAGGAPAAGHQGTTQQQRSKATAAAP
jgi:hypothetical protein